MNSKILTLAMIGVLMCVPLAIIDVDGADTGFDITDTTGQSFHFDAPAERVVLNGVGAILTVASAGKLDKVVGVDKYATYDYTKNEALKDLDAKVLGSFFSSSYSNIIVELANMVDAGEFSKDDPILLTSYPGNVNFRTMLNEAGFTNVLVWVSNDVDTYDDILKFVKDVTMIVSGTEGDAYGVMTDVVDRVNATVSESETAPKALPVWYSADSGFMILNKGIAVSMLNLCGAELIGYKADGANKYGDKNEIINLLDANPGTTIFLDGGWAKAGYTTEDFRDQVLGGNASFNIVQMDSMWNNYCPESAEGLLVMTEALYGEPSDGTSGSDDEGGMDILPWIVVIVIVIIIAGVAFTKFKGNN